MIEEKIEELKKRIDEVTKDIKSSKSLAELKMAFFGKQGEISRACATCQRKSAPKWER